MTIFLNPGSLSSEDFLIWACLIEKGSSYLQLGGPALMLQQMLWCRWNATSRLDADKFSVINLSGALCCRGVFNHHFLVQLQSWNILLNCTHLMKKFFPAVHTPVTSCVREVWPVGKSPMDDPQTILGRSPIINRGPCKCIVRAGYVELYRGYFPIFMCKC